MLLHHPRQLCGANFLFALVVPIADTTHSFDFVMFSSLVRVTAKAVPARRFCARYLSSAHPAWRLGRLNHVAVATPKLADAIKLYRDVLGAKVSDPEDLPAHGVTVVFVSLDNTKIELLQPLGDKSPIASFLSKNANGGIHHVCIEVDDINAAVKDLKAKNVRCLTEEPRIGAHGKPVMFLHPKDCAGVLVELEQA